MECGEMEKESEKDIWKFLSEGHKFTQHIRALIKKNASIRMTDSGHEQQSINLPEIQMNENTPVANRLRELRPTGKNVLQNVQNIGSEKLLLLEPIKSDNDSLSLAFLKRVVEIFHADVFIETGTLTGGTAAEAAKVFREVHTIELSHELFQKALERFESNSNVCVYHGDSAEVLPDILPRIQGKCVFWLDGHYSGEETARGKENTPVIQEIEAIRDQNVQDAIILIDDIRCFYRELNPSSIHYGYPTIRNLFAAILEIDPTYCFEVLGDAVIAYPSNSGIKISSVIRGCTISRFFDENPEIGGLVLAAEQNISNADGAEHEAIINLCRRFGLTNAPGWGKYYALWLGLILYNRKHFTESVESFSALDRTGFNHWRIRWYLARAEYESGDLPAAQSSLSAVLKAVPDFKAAQSLMTIVKNCASKNNSVTSTQTMVQNDNPQKSHTLSINIVYGHYHPENVAIRKRGNISVIWSRLPIAGCDHYVYHNAFSFRGRLPGLNILLMLKPAVVLPGEFDDEIWNHFDHVFGLFDALTERGHKFHKLFFPACRWNAGNNSFRVAEKTRNALSLKRSQERHLHDQWKQTVSCRQ